MIRAIVAMSLLATAPAWAGDPGHAQPPSHATASASAAASANAGSASHATGGSITTGNIGGGGNAGRAPDVVLPSMGGGGFDCPTVGFGAGGSGLGGGGGFGPSWISSDCNNRKLVPIVRELYGDDVARAFVERNMPGVRDAATGWRTTTVYPPDYCATRNRGDANQHLECNTGGK